jgi:hypothetical protein
MARINAEADSGIYACFTRAVFRIRTGFFLNSDVDADHESRSKYRFLSNSIFSEKAPLFRLALNEGIPAPGEASSPPQRTASSSEHDFP